MLLGLSHHRRLELLEYKVGVNGTRSLSGSDPGRWAKGTLKTRWTDTPSTTITGLEIGVKLRETLSGAETIYTLELPHLGVTRTLTSAGWNSGAIARLEIDDPVVYAAAGDSWLVGYSEIRWYIEGSLQETFGADQLTGDVFTTAGVPLFGIPPRLIPSQLAAESIATSATGVCTGDFTSTVSGVEAFGGWRAKVDGEWQEFDVKLESGDPPALAGCDIGELTMPGSAVLKTWDAEAYGYSQISCVGFEAYEKECPVVCPVGCSAGSNHIFEISGADLTTQARGFEVSLLPNFPKAMRRMAQGHVAKWYRGGFPEARRRNIAGCATTFGTSGPCAEPVDPEVEGTITYDSVHPALPAAVNLVTDVAHEIELPFYEGTYAPYYAYATKTETRAIDIAIVAYGECACPVGIPPVPDPPNCCFEEDQWKKVREQSSYFPSLTHNGDEIDAFRHPDDEAAYINSWGSPGWHYFQVFPPDDTDEYWIPLRQQHFDGDDLPKDERTLRRNFVIAEPLQEGGLQTPRNIFGVNTSWVGISRFLTDLVVLPTSKTMTSSMTAGWSFVNCTPSFGAGGITLTPSNTVITAKLDCGRFADSLFMYPHIAKIIDADWGATNIVSVAVKLVNAEGSQITLATLPGSYPRPVAVDGKYAGSWAQDYGLGVVSDTGADLLGSGVSTATMSDEERILAYQFFVGKGCKEIWFEITVASTGATCLLKYPTFRLSSDNPRVIQETGMATAVIWADGPGVRFGQSDWGTGTDIAASPSIRPPGEKATVLDWLAHKRVFFLSLLATSGLNAEIATLFDVNEGQSREDVQSDTIAFLWKSSDLDLIGVIVNSLAEAPPMCCLPQYRKRDDNGAEDPDEAWMQESFTLSQEYRYIVSARDALHMELPTSPPRYRITELDPVQTSGWKITRHRTEVDNSEGATFKVLQEGVGDLADASPYHGFFATPGVGVNGGNIHMTRSRQTGLLFACVTNGDGIRVNRFRFGAIDDWHTVLESPDVSSAQIAYHPRGKLGVFYCESGEVLLTESLDYAETWSEPLSIATGTNPAAVIDDKTGIEYVAIHDGTDWECWRRLSEGDSWVIAGRTLSNPTYGKILTASASQGGLVQSPDTGNKLVFYVDDGSAVRRFYSTDQGETWTEAS